MTEAAPSGRSALLPTPDGQPPAASQLRPNEPFRMAIEAAPTGMIVVDEHGRIALVNAQTEKLFGYRREELVGQPIEMLVPVFRRDFMGDARARPLGPRRDLFGRYRDGTQIPIEIGLNPLRTAEGQFMLSSVVDIAERKRGEQERDQLLAELQALNAQLEQRVQTRTAELVAMLREREVLLQEVHHRVKNNLQVISSLINIQVRSLADPASRQALVECQTRVQAIALIHEQLHHSREYTRVPFAEYARTLAGNVFAATGESSGRVALQFSTEDVALTVDKAIACGLILNELLTNALKHAFPNGRSGTIRVELGYAEGGGLRLEVADDGVGLPPGFDLQDAPSLGLQLVRMLASQLEADFQVDSGGVGLCLRFRFGLEA